MTEEKDIGWMYQGAKSGVNREDYLLGKRVDKNFEKYSDAVVDQKEEAIDSIVRSRTIHSTGASSLQSKVSTLDINTVRTEDPLVAVKVREETRRREMMSNPLTRMKFEKLLKNMMTKGEKKKKKKKDKKNDSDSDDGKKRQKKQKKEKKKKTKKSKKSSSIDETSSSDGESEKKRDSLARKPSSPRTDRARSNSRDRKRKSGENGRHIERTPAKRKRYDSDSADGMRKVSPSDKRRIQRTSQKRYDSDSDVESKSNKKRRTSRDVERERHQHSYHRRSSKSPTRRRSPSLERLTKRDRSGERRRERSPPRRHRSRERSYSPERRRRGNSSRDRSPLQHKKRESRDVGSHERSAKKSERHRHDSESDRVEKRTLSSQKRTGEESDVENKKEKIKHSDEDSDNENARSYGMHIPEHLKEQATHRSSCSRSPSPKYDREEEEKQKKFQGYGLVGVKKKDTENDLAPSLNPYTLKKLPTTGTAQPYTKPASRARLTEEEKAARLAEMQSNAVWRDETRKGNLKKAVEADKAEEEEESQGKAASFIRPMLNAANESDTVSKRLQTNKRNLQKGHGYMEKKFTQR